MIKSLLKNSIIYGGAKALTIFLGFLALPILTTHLNPDDYGVLSLLQLALILLNLTVALEITQAVARFMADKPSNKHEYVSTGFYFMIFMHFVSALLLFIFAVEIANILFNKSGFEIYIYFLIPWIFFKAIHYFTLNQMRWENRPIYFSILQTGAALISLIFIFILVNILGMGLKAAITSYILGLLFFGFIGVFILIKKDSLKLFFSTKILKKMLYFSLPLVLSSAAIFAQSYIDRIMITNFLSLHDLGIYSFGFQIASLLLLPIMAFSMSLTPLVYEKYKDISTPKNIAEAFNIFLFCVFASGIGLVLFLPELFYLFIGKQFYSSYFIIPLLILSVVLSGIYVFTPGLAIKKKTKYIALISIVGMVLNIMFNFILIPLYGIYGASIATVLSMSSVVLLYFYTGQKNYKIPYIWQSVTIGTILFVGLVFTIPLFDELNITTIFSLDLLLKIIFYIITVIVFYVIFIKPLNYKITLLSIKSIWKPENNG